MLTIHGRTKAQMSKVPADWEAIGVVRQLRDQLSPDTLIIGNGDVMNRQQGLDLAKKHKLDGIMIGRGIFQDPFVFAEQSPWPKQTAQQRQALYKKHVELFAETWKKSERPIQTLNKFCKIYINGFDGAKELREQLMSAGSNDELVRLLS
jgi:tRNA-dihydrouridine synthase